MDAEPSICIAADLALAQIKEYLGDISFVCEPPVIAIGTVSNIAKSSQSSYVESIRTTRHYKLDDEGSSLGTTIDPLLLLKQRHENRPIDLGESSTLSPS